MFQSIGSGLKKRTVALNEQAGVSRKTTAVVLELYQSFGLSSNNTPTLFYDSDKNSLTIETKTKVVASEFLLRITELRAMLREKGVLPEKIIIR